MNKSNRSPHPYYKPENFYDTKNIAYSEFKLEFDRALQIFIESDKLKEKIKKYFNNEQYASMLIFAASQNLFISILKLCNEGIADVAGILLRSLFEDYVQIKYIKKKKLGSLFINFLWISLKRELDRSEMHISNTQFVEGSAYQANKALINEQYIKYKDDYTKKNRKWNKVRTWFNPKEIIQYNWSGKNLLKMAKNVGERASYNTIMPFHSKFVHCDPYGLMGFLKGGGNSTIIENSASTEGIELTLNVSIEIYSRIAIEMASSFDMPIPDLFRQFISHKQTDN